MGCGGSKESNQNASVSTTSKPTNPQTVDPAPQASPPTDKPVVDAAPKEFNFKPIHSAFRWNKPIPEIKALMTSPEAINCIDTQTGNSPIHIAAQNGHNSLVAYLIELGCNVNLKNGKGNSAIHMAIGYDYYDAAVMLINAGGDPNQTNDMGFPANRGLEGDKCMAIAALVCAQTANDVNNALKLCEEQSDLIDKVSYVQAGMKVKKILGPLWSEDMQTKFKEILSKLG